MDLLRSSFGSFGPNPDPIERQQELMELEKTLGESWEKYQQLEKLAKNGIEPESS